MKKIRIEDAIGSVLAHDLTMILPGEYKGPAFKKGHIITAEDIPELRKMGKNHLNIININDQQIHEDLAALRIAQAVAGENIYLTTAAEGKVNLKASKSGILKVNQILLDNINDIDMVVVATLHNNTLVEAHQTLAGAKIIPLTIEKKSIETLESICDGQAVLSIKPLQSLPIGIVVTGDEVCHGLIDDRFGPVLAAKVDQLGCTLVGLLYADDQVTNISAQIEILIAAGAKIVMISGGMSVDADDVTPQAIEQSADQVISYGTPVLPGAMFMLAYQGEVALLGVPACGMFHRVTVLDLVLPRILAGERLVRRDLTQLAHGGLCQNCNLCHYPNCSFGK